MADGAGLPTHEVVYLFASMTPVAVYKSNQTRAEQILEARGVPLTPLDGADKQNHVIRDALWAVSKKKGIYPQFFLRDREDGSCEFVCDFNGLFKMNEIEDDKQALSKAFAKAMGSLSSGDSDDSGSEDEEDDEEDDGGGGETAQSPPRQKEAATGAGGVARAGSGGAQGSPRRCLRLGDWEQLEDETGQHYFHNLKSGVVQWRKPEEMVKANPWSRYVDEDQTPYYHNALTGETTWERPKELGGCDGDWREFAKGGRPFFVNNKTGESTWQRPEALQ